LKEEDLSWIGLDYKNGHNLLNFVAFPSIKFDFIVHLAGISDMNYSYLHPFETINTNFQITLNVLEKARLDKSMVIFPSTCLVYNPKKAKVAEIDDLSPRDPYSFSKKVCEDLVLFYSKTFTIPVAILRLFNVYGKFLKENTLFYDVIKQIQDEKTITVNILNNASFRDYIHIDDVVNIFVQIINSRIDGVFNIGSGKGYKPKEIAQLIMNTLGIRKEIEISDPSVIEEFLISENSSIEKKLKYSSRISILDGIKELIQLYSREM